MYRNLDYRTEVAVPINNIDLQEEIRKYISIQLRDNSKSRLLNLHKQDNVYISSTGKSPIRAQHEIHKWISTKHYTAFRFNTLLYSNNIKSTKKIFNNKEAKPRTINKHQLA